MSIRGKRFLLGVVKKGGYRGVKEKGLGKTIGGNKGGYRRGIFLKVLTRFFRAFRDFRQILHNSDFPHIFPLGKSEKSQKFSFHGNGEQKSKFFHFTVEAKKGKHPP